MQAAGSLASTRVGSKTTSFAAAYALRSLYSAAETARAAQSSRARRNMAGEGSGLAANAWRSLFATEAARGRLERAIGCAAGRSAQGFGCGAPPPPLPYAVLNHAAGRERELSRASNGSSCLISVVPWDTDVVYTAGRRYKRLRAAARRPQGRASCYHGRQQCSAPPLPPRAAAAAARHSGARRLLQLAPRVCRRLGAPVRQQRLRLQVGRRLRSQQAVGSPTGPCRRSQRQLQLPLLLQRRQRGSHLLLQRRAAGAGGCGRPLAKRQRQLCGGRGRAVLSGGWVRGQLGKLSQEGKEPGAAQQQPEQTVIPSFLAPPAPMCSPHVPRGPAAPAQLPPPPRPAPAVCPSPPAAACGVPPPRRHTTAPRQLALRAAAASAASAPAEQWRAAAPPLQPRRQWAGGSGPTGAGWRLQALHHLAGGPAPGQARLVGWQPALRASPLGAPLQVPRELRCRRGRAAAAGALAPCVATSRSSRPRP